MAGPRKLMVVALAAGWCAVGGAAAQLNLVEDPSFESGALAPNWQVAAGAGHGAWTVGSGKLPGIDGNRYAEAQFSFLDGVVLYQDVPLPDKGNFSLQVAIACNFGGAKTKGDLCRVDVTDLSPESVVPPTPRQDTLETTGTGVLEAVFARTGDDGSTEMSEKSVSNIKGVAGKTVRVRIMALASTRPITVTVDNVRLTRSHD